MIKLIRFLTAKKSFVLFILLEITSIILIINTHNYAQTKTHSLQTTISGIINSKLSVIENHFKLKEYNKQLLKQNAELLNKWVQPETQKSPLLKEQYGFIPAFVISNQYQFSHNTILINKGRIDGIQPDMGIIAPNGIAGIVQKTSKHFAKALSILNTGTKINVALKNSNYTGFMRWEGQDPNIFSVIDMPVNAQIKVGDTIVTSGVSNIFPKNIPIGKIIDFNTVSGRKSYNIKIQSFTDMSNLGPVYIIKNIYKKEADSLMQDK